MFMLVVGLLHRQRFPQALARLLEARLSEVDRLALVGVRSEYLSLRAAATRAPAFLFGWGFLGAVTVWGHWHHLGLL